MPRRIRRRQRHGFSAGSQLGLSASPFHTLTRQERISKPALRHLKPPRLETVPNSPKPVPPSSQMSENDFKGALAEVNCALNQFLITERKPIHQTLDKPHLQLLPQELRDMIYEYVFEDSRVDLAARGETARGAGLLLTCKQLYFEARKLYYRESVFFAKNSKYTDSFIIGLPTQPRNWVKQIRFNGPCEGCHDPELLGYTTLRIIWVDVILAYSVDNIAKGVLKNFISEHKDEEVSYALDELESVEDFKDFQD